MFVTDLSLSLWIHSKMVLKIMVNAGPTYSNRDHGPMSSDLQTGYTDYIYTAGWLDHRISLLASKTYFSIG